MVFKKSCCCCWFELELERGGGIVIVRNVFLVADRNWEVQWIDHEPLEGGNPIGRGQGTLRIKDSWVANKGSKYFDQSRLALQVFRSILKVVFFRSSAAAVLAAVVLGV